MPVEEAPQGEQNPAGGEPANYEQQPDQQQSETDWKAEARKWEQRAKANKADADELEKFRAQAMTDAEKAAAEAEKRGRDAAAKDYGRRLARSEFLAAAARRNPDDKTEERLAYLDLSQFVGDDGEPDTAKIAAAVESLVPTGAPPPPSFDGGARQSPPAGSDMNKLLRQAAGRG